MKLLFLAVIVSCVLLVSDAEKVRKYKKYRKPAAEEVPPNAIVEDEFKIQESDEKFEANSKIVDDTGSVPESEARDALLPIIDPCMKVQCGAGKICQVDSMGDPQCVCIPECPVETESRRKVCTNHNETWTSDCAVYQQRCLCNTGDAKCKGNEYKHVHIEYYGECREMPVVDKLSKGENFLISPLSLETAFAMVYAGAKEDTAEELARGLSFPNDTQKLFSQFKQIIPLFRSNEHFDLNIANRLYIQHNFTLLEEYKKNVVDVFGAGLENVDFLEKDKAAKEINGWVEKETKEKIKDIIKPSDFNEFTRLVVVNALYFKAKWDSQFNALYTRKERFFTNEKDSVEVDMMTQTSYFNYYECSEVNAKFLEMPYEHEDISMVIVLPNEKQGLAALEAKVEDIFKEKPFKKEYVQVSIPKFRIESNIDLNQVFKELGVEKPFGTSANFKGISEDGDLFISKALQKTYISVAEEGTEAAAATIADFEPYSAVRAVKQFEVDQPFAFYVKDKRNNVLYFAGKILKI